jgi:beta-phosphoglucomutase
VIRAVVFDFDGVIANSEPLHFRAFHEVLADEGITLTEAAYYGRYLGFDDVGAFRAIAADQQETVDDARVAAWVARKARRLEALEAHTSVLFPGAREAIERLAARGPIAIASGALRAEIERVLERERLLAHFAVLVAAEDTPRSKPDPAPYVRAVAGLAGLVPALTPGQCVAIEDSRWGLASARTAGLRTIGITTSYTADELPGAELVVDHLDAITGELLSTLA